MVYRVGKAAGVFAAVMGLVLFQAERSDADTITLADVVRLALSRNERSRIATLNVEVAEAGVGRARAAFLPTVGISGSETLRPYSIEQGGRTVTRSNAASGALTINQPLLALTAFPLYAGAKHTFEASLKDEINQRQKLCFDAARAFFGAIAQERVLTAAHSRLDRADASLNDTKARAAAQLVSTNDVTRAQVERASAVASVASAESSLEQARANLDYILDTTVQGELAPPQEDLAPFALDAAHLNDRAIAERPDLASARESALAAASLADEPRLRFVPTLNASGQARVADQPVVGDRYVDTTLTLTLNWPLWDAGIRFADSDSRHAAAETLTLQMQALKRKIQADLRTATAELTAARTSEKAAEDGVDAARRSANETSVLYKQGLAKAIELLDANLSTFESEVTLAAAQLALRQAELDLRAALGLFPLDGVK